MRRFTLKTVLLLYIHSWICESQTVEVQSGEDATLLCSNISTSLTLAEWFRVVNGSEPSCVSSMFFIDAPASLCDGFLKGKFEMSSNITTVFLKIKRVDFSDSGLYFCGFFMGKHIVISTATELIIPDINEPNNEVEFNTEKEADRMTYLMSVVLAALTVFLTAVVIVLAVKVRKLQSAVNEEDQSERNKDLRSDDLNYAALSFQGKGKRSCRSAEREMESHVVYAATR